MFNAAADKIVEIFESIFIWMFESFIQPFVDMPTLKNLVFGRDDEAKSVWGTFRPNELTDALNPMFYTMATLSGFFLVAFIVLYGIRISGAPLNSSRRNEMIEFFKDLLIVGIVLANLPTLYDLLFQINMGIVNMFSGAYDSQSIDRMNDIGKDFLQDSATGQATMGILGLIFVQLILLGLMVWANFYYLMRKVTLLILMALGPLMIVFYLHPQFKPITASWLRELVGSIFVQSIHAFVFWTVATLSAQDNGFVGTVIVYLIFIPISESVRRLFNMGGEMQGGLAKAGSMLGMAALAGMAGSVKGALDGQSVMGALKGAYSGTKGSIKGKNDIAGANGDDLKNTIGANAGGDMGTTPRAEKMLRAGEIMGKMGKATFGMAGAIAGSPLGPVGAMIGASGGFAAGGVVGGFTGRAGAATAQGIADRIQKGAKAAKGLDLKNDDFDKNLMNEIADRDTASWAQRSEGSVKASLREKFPEASEKEIDNRFNDEKAKARQGFYEGAKANYTSAIKNSVGKASGNQLVATSSQAMANAWGDENQQAFNDEFDKNHPQKRGESQLDYYARRGSAFNEKKAEMKKAFAEKGQAYVSKNAADGMEPLNKNDFSNHMGQAIQGIAGVGDAEKISQASAAAIDHVQGASLFKPVGKKGNGKVSGNQLVATSSNAMANAWGNENQQAFNDDYEKNNPQRADESPKDYATRRGNAFNQKKAQMKEAFSEMGKQYVTQTTTDGNQPIDAKDFSNHMSQAVQGVTGIGNSKVISQAGMDAIDQVQSASLSGKRGKPNVLFLASSLANGKTTTMGESFVAEQQANGVSRIDAEKDWNQNHKPKVHASNLSMYKDSIESASDSNFSAGVVGVGQRVGQKLFVPQIATFAAEASGVTPLIRSASQGIKATNDGLNAGLTTFAVGRDGAGMSYKNIIPAMKDTYYSGVSSMIEQNGAVESQANYQNNAGYVGGVFGGVQGYQASKRLASKLSPMRQQVQEAIHSPGEVIQMAQTVTDDHGNVQVAPGAIRQVTTPTESYIEVRTRTGETQVVSRKGAGHSGLKKGDKVYQDLSAQGDTLVVSSDKGSPSSTYRLDSAGGRVPSSVNVESHPSTLLGNPLVGNTHKPQQRSQVQSYNQAVDNGKFYVGDITDQGMENVQVVVEKDRQFVTAQKDGSTYRVSPIYAGDSRLSSTETVHIPVSVKQQKLVPTKTPQSEVAVQSIIQSNPTSYNVNTEQADTPYYSSRDVNTLMESKHSVRANQSIGKRQELDTVRRKQGLLG